VDTPKRRLDVRRIVCKEALLASDHDLGRFDACCIGSDKAERYYHQQGLMIVLERTNLCIVHTILDRPKKNVNKDPHV